METIIRLVCLVLQTCDNVQDDGFRKTLLISIVRDFANAKKIQAGYETDLLLDISNFCEYPTVENKTKLENTITNYAYDCPAKMHSKNVA